MVDIIEILLLLRKALEFQSLQRKNTMTPLAVLDMGGSWYPSGRNNGPKRQTQQAWGELDS